MRYALSLFIFTSLIGSAAIIVKPKVLTISLGSDGSSKDQIPALKPGDEISFSLPAGAELLYQFSPDIGDGAVLMECAGAQPAASGAKISIPTTATVKRTDPAHNVNTEVRALYFNLYQSKTPDTADAAKLREIQLQLDYYNGLSHSLDWLEKKRIQTEIANRNDRISALHDEIKAFTGMSLAAAVDAINQRQTDIRQLRAEIKDRQKMLEYAGYDDQVKQLTAQYQQLKATVDQNSVRTLLRAGVIPVGENRKPVYYSLNPTADAAAPWLLRRYQSFPVLTTDDTPYVVVLGQKLNQDPQALRATFATKAGSYIDSDPVRPVLTQASATSQGKRLEFTLPNPAACTAPKPPTDAFVDRVLQFTDRLAGETVYTVTVAGYGSATKDDTITVSAGATNSTQHQTVKAMMTLTPLPGDAWPQVHSLYRYNLASGVIWSPDRIPSFSRVATGGFLPTGCTPNSTSTANGPTSSTTTGTTTTSNGSVSTTTPTVTNTDPSASTATTCLPTYSTVKVTPRAGIMPVLMFSRYWVKRDTQTKKGSWWWVVPVPTVGLSLTSPTTDFFFGASSEFPFLRNVQLVYGAHLARVPTLGANSFQNPTDSTAPQTTTSLRTGEFVGLTFNLDFIKGLFKP